MIKPRILFSSTFLALLCGHLSGCMLVPPQNIVPPAVRDNASALDRSHENWLRTRQTGIFGLRDQPAAPCSCP